ncbi:MAG: hypothetical protein AAF664_05505 [Planctomycetota bacterium]
MLKFEELQVIWDRQREQPLFAIRHGDLVDLVRDKAASIERSLGMYDAMMIGVPLLMAVILPVDAWREGGGLDEYAIALVCLVVGLAALKSHISRRSNEPVFDQSIKQIAESCLKHLDAHVRQLSWFFWCFHLPVAILAALGLTFYTNTRTPLVWAGVLAITAISYWDIRRDIQSKRAKREEISQILQKLVEADNTSEA